MSERSPNRYRVRGAGWLLAIASLLASTASCSVLVDPNRVQCSSTKDCTKFGDGMVCQDALCQTDPKWSCVGYVERPVAESRMVSVTVNFIDLLSPLSPLAPGIQALACQKLDTECKTPVATGTTTDKGASITFEVPAGFDGFVSFHDDSHLPGLFFITPPPVTDRDLAAIPLVAPDTLTALAFGAGTTIREDRGHLLIAAYDCNGNAAQGIGLSVSTSDEQSDHFYFVEGFPQVKATQTDDSGWGGFLNLPFGITQVTATEESRDKAVGNASFLVRPGTLTYSALVPSPGLPPFSG